LFDCALERALGAADNEPFCVVACMIFDLTLWNNSPFKLPRKCEIYCLPGRLIKIKWVDRNFNIVVHDRLIEVNKDAVLVCFSSESIQLICAHQYSVLDVKFKFRRSAVPRIRVLPRFLSSQQWLLDKCKWILLYYISKHPWAKVLVVFYFETAKWLVFTDHVLCFSFLDN